MWNLSEISREFGLDGRERRVLRLLAKNLGGLTFSELKRDGFNNKTLERVLGNLRRFDLVDFDLRFDDLRVRRVYKFTGLDLRDGTFKNPPLLWHLPILGVGRLGYMRLGILPNLEVSNFRNLSLRQNRKKKRV